MQHAAYLFRRDFVERGVRENVTGAFSICPAEVAWRCMAAISRSIFWIWARSASLRSDNLTSCRSVALGMLVSIPPLCAEELRLQPSKVAHFWRFTYRSDHGARANDKATAECEHQ